MALTTHHHLVVRLTKEYRCTSTPHLDLQGLLYVECYLHFYPLLTSVRMDEHILKQITHYMHNILKDYKMGNLFMQLLIQNFLIINK